MSEPESLPPVPVGTAATRFNAVKHGVLSRHTLLPWEDATEYDAILDALAAEHAPRGPTEEHLVEELAGILWRKRRLRLAEAAAWRRGVKDTFASFRETAKAALAHRAGVPDGDVSEAVQSTPEDMAAFLRELEAEEAAARRALQRLAEGGDGAYEAAMAALCDIGRDMWADSNGPDDAEPEYTPDAEGLGRFLRDELMTWITTQRREQQALPLIREQAFGEAFSPDRLEQLARYEVHLDRKFERTLAMLLKLKDLRQGRGGG